MIAQLWHVQPLCDAATEGGYIEQALTQHGDDLSWMGVDAVGGDETVQALAAYRLGEAVSPIGG